MADAINNSLSKINYGSGFSPGDLTLNGGAILNGYRLQLTDGATWETRSTFYSAKVNVQKFTSDFSFQLTKPVADGIAFVIQNDAPTTIGSGTGGLGYGGITNSIAIKFDIFNNSGEGDSSTGLYTNGSYPTIPATDLLQAGVDLHDGQIFNVHVNYDGATLTWTITNSTDSSKSFTTSTSINIPTTIGSTLAYVGFTGSTGGAGAIQEIIRWTFDEQSGNSAVSAEPVVGEPALTIASPTEGSTVSAVDLWVRGTCKVGLAVNVTTHSQGFNSPNSVTCVNGHFALPALLVGQGGTRSFTLSQTSSAGALTQVGRTVSYTPKGQVFYVDAEQGDDANDGLSEAHAWKSLSKVNSLHLEAGSSILFKRGQIWRGRLLPLADGTVDAPITYSAFGSFDAAKPEIRGSVDCSGAGAWSLVAGKTNIWESIATFHGDDGATPVDIGNVIFDNGASFGVKRWSIDQLAAEGDYYSNFNWFYASDPKYPGNIYIYSKQNPGKKFGSLECARTLDTVDLSNRSYLVLQKLAIKYGGANGIMAANAHNLALQELDISYTGGGLLLYDANKQYMPVRYGNGITLWGNASNVIVERNRIWEIYDTGLTNQSSVASSMQNNITYRNNLIWNCAFASFELWTSDSGSKMMDVTVENNTAWGAGRGWGMQRPDQKGWHLSLGDTPVPVDHLGRIVIQNNVFSDAQGLAFVIQDPNQWKNQLALDYNNWYHPAAGALGVFGASGTAFSVGDLTKYSAVTGYDAHSSTADPKLINPWEENFNLDAKSPCIDAGITTSATSDFAWTARPQGQAYDIGAYEETTLP